MRRRPRRAVLEDVLKELRTTNRLLARLLATANDSTALRNLGYGSSLPLIQQVLTESDES